MFVAVRSFNATDLESLQDWRAEKPLVDTMVKRIPRQPAFIPRNGELVMYLRPLPPGIELQQGAKTQQFFLQDTLKNRSAGSPQWLAGVVTQVPSSAGDTVSLYPPSQVSIPANGSHEPDPLSLSVTGYRIEPLPSINDSDKNLSKQHSYVPLYLIRPFCFWKSLLQGIPESEWHVSIHNAIIASATVSLIDRQHFTGHWPDASINSRGLYVGAECYWIGDTVRLLTEPPSPATIVMKIQKIITTFHNLIPEPANPNIVTGNKCDQITITIQGPVYSTLNPTPSLDDNNPVPTKLLSNPMRTFNNTQWYPINNNPNDEIHTASFSTIHSRLYESSALTSYFPALPPPTLLHLDSKGEPIIHARSIAAATDERIVGGEDEERGKKWFWAG
ncbi:MAG: hypothetical protein Q9224_002409, partial [Gallowayella concinna]